MSEEKKDTGIVKLTDLAKNVGSIQMDKISLKNAEEGVDAMLLYYRVPLDSIANEETKSSISDYRDKCIVAAMEGRLEFSLEPDADGISQLMTMQKLISRKDGHEQVLRYREVDGKSKKAMKSCGNNDSMGKIQAMMASLCGWTPSAIEGLRGPDLALMEALGAIFLTM